MAYKNSMNSNDNYGENNVVPSDSNEERVKKSAQRTTGSDPVIRNNMGAASERKEDKHILGYYDQLN